MARYIDADALIEDIQETVCGKCGDISDGIKCKSCGTDDTFDFLENAPTADVVPKSKVEELKAIIADHKANEEQWQELYADTASKWEKACEELEIKLENAKVSIAREIFEEIEFDIHQLMFDRDETRAIAIEGVIAELKKKYTEREK